jgi:hypothetical protein
MEIKLNFTNGSNDTHNSKFTVFQKNVASKFDELAVAWRVVQNVEPDERSTFRVPEIFTLPETFRVSAGDSDVNGVAQLLAQGNHNFQVVLHPSGGPVEHAGQGILRWEMLAVNALTPGAVDGNLLRGGPLRGTQLYSAPQSTAAFSLGPLFRIEAIPGQAVEAALVSRVHTEIPQDGGGAAKGAPELDGPPIESRMIWMARSQAWSRRARAALESLSRPHQWPAVDDLRGDRRCLPRQPHHGYRAAGRCVLLVALPQRQQRQALRQVEHPAVANLPDVRRALQPHTGRQFSLTL